VTSRDLNRRWLQFAAALAVLIALALLLVVPQGQHASLLLAALAPVLLLFSIVITQARRALTDELLIAPGFFLELPSLSHLPPPGTLA
jgi:hypothetical protein